MAIKSILIANRGEIAVRIIRACRVLNLRAIAVHSEADSGALWTRLADEAHDIGPAPARESYLDIDRIVATALAAGADAVHPGYGLLSENPDFARAVSQAGLIFIGPAPACIARMGDKTEARQAASDAGLPVLPGTGGPVSDIAEALKAADNIGWPIAVKASFGGGGRGMRVARDASQLEAAMAQSTREAQAAFGRGEIYLERYLDRPRHVEVQVLADNAGNVVHLGTRDCSIQRRHQKLVEEAPAPKLPAELIARIEAAAVALAREENYRGAGTVEFLVDRAGSEFFFLEMNTRLQVEHGVTEMVTGVDIVCEQIRVAGGELLSLVQGDIRINGHAIQARIAAEDPWENFRPAPAPIDKLDLPGGPGVRCDFGCAAGDDIPPYYDSMFGKVQAWGATREEARHRLAVALGELAVTGPVTTAPYLRMVIDQAGFAEVAHDTGSLESEWQPEQLGEKPPAAPTASALVPPRFVSVPWGASHSVIAIHREASASTGDAAAMRTDSGGQGLLAAQGKSGPDILAPMDATVATISVAAGKKVSRGETIVVLEAMKMEVPIAAPHDGAVARIVVAIGDTVRSGSLLAVIEGE